MNTDDLQPLIVLDPSTGNTVQPGYTRICNDVEFLQSDGPGVRLWVVGEHLCRWVASIYRMRGYRQGHDYVTLSSPHEKLHSILGSKVEQLSPALVQKILKVLSKHRRVPTVVEILLDLTGESLFVEPPSLEHAARWLQIDVPDGMEPLAELAASQWAKQAEPPLNVLYGSGLDSRRDLLRQWLGIEEALETLPVGELEMFPMDLHPEVCAEYLACWGRRLRQSEGRCVEDFDSRFPNTSDVARIAFDYFQDHPEHLQRKHVAILSPCLDEPRRVQLEQRLPVPEPEPISLEVDADEVLSWACQSYLPYRYWQIEHAPQQSTKAEELAASFVQWLLHNYPRLASIERERSPVNVVVPYQIQRLLQQCRALWVIVDGLSYRNHQRLTQLLAQTEASLHVEMETALFAALPTVTEYAKWSLITGQYPASREEGKFDPKSELSKMFPEAVYVGDRGHRRLRQSLIDVQSRLIVWNVTSIDKCYHSYNERNARQHRIQAELMTLANTLSDMVLDAPDGDQLALVLSSDHGQLIGASCRHSGPREPQLPAQGRTIFGQIEEQPIHSSYRYLEDELIVELNPTSFHIPRPMTLAADSRHFEPGMLTDPDGQAYGVHGGLYPEEVVVGLAILSRHVEYQEVKAVIEGTGNTGQSGILRLTVENPNRVELRHLLLKLVVGEETRLVALERTISANAKKVFEHPFDPWPEPDPNGKASVSGRLQFSYPDGQGDEAPIAGSLESRSLYQRSGPSLKGRLRRS